MVDDKPRCWSRLNITLMKSLFYAAHSPDWNCLTLFAICFVRGQGGGQRRSSASSVVVDDNCLQCQSNILAQRRRAAGSADGTRKGWKVLHYCWLQLLYFALLYWMSQQNNNGHWLVSVCVYYWMQCWPPVTGLVIVHDPRELVCINMHVVRKAVRLLVLGYSYFFLWSIQHKTNPIGNNVTVTRQMLSHSYFKC